MIGTFRNNALTGWLHFESIEMQFVTIGEVKANYNELKNTFYSSFGKVENKLYRNAELEECTLVTNPEDAWFGTGNPHNK